MEIVRYVICDENGDVHGTYAVENNAICSSSFKKGRMIVKLVGELHEPKKNKRIAEFVIKTEKDKYLVYSEMLTQEEAKQVCVELYCELFQWPRGEVVEIEE